MCLFKTIFKGNIKKYILIFFVLAFSCMSLIVSLDFKTVSSNAVVNMLDKQTLGIHLSIKSSEYNGKDFVYEKEELAIRRRKDIKYNAPIYALACNYANQNSALIGINKDNYKDLSINIIEESKEKYDNGIYISKSKASITNLKLDDNVIVYINSERYRFVLKGILDDGAFMTQNGNPFLCELSYLTSLIKKDGRATNIFVGLNDLNNIDEVYTLLMKSLEKEKITVVKNYNPDNYTFFLEPIGVSITIFSIFALFISTFLIYYIFKGLVISGQKRIATQKSLGVRTKDLYISSLFGALCLTFVSSLLGVLLACCLNNILSICFTTATAFSFRFTSYLIALGIMIVICASSLLIAEYKIFNKGIIPLLKGDSISRVRSGIGKILSIVLPLGYLLISGITLVILFNNKTIVASVISIILLTGIIIIVSYYLVLFILFVLEKLHFKKSLFYRRNRRSLNLCRNIITLMSLVILLVSIVSVVSKTITSTLSNYYSDIDAIMETTNETLSNSCLEENKKKYEIDSYYRSYYLDQKKNDFSIHIHGVNPKDYLNYSHDSFVSDSASNVMQYLGKKDTIIISTTLANKLDLKLEDKITLLTKTGNKDFVIVGLVNSLEDGGNNVVISEKTFNENFYFQKVRYYITLTARGSFQNLIELYGEYKNQFQMSIFDVSKLMESNNQSINSLIGMIYFLIIIISLVALANIVMSMVIDIKCQAKEISVERSLGKSQSKLIFENCYKYFFILIIPSLVAVVSAGLINYYVFEIINKTIGYFTFNYSISILALIIGVFMYGLSILFSAISLKKNNVVLGIKGGE